MSKPLSTEEEPRPGFTRPVLLALAVASAAGAAAALYQLRPASQGVQGTCERLASALERRDRAALESLVSADYRDDRGLSRATLVPGVLRYLDDRGFSRVRLVGEVDVHLEGDETSERHARAHASAKVALARTNPAAPGGANALRIELSLLREGGRWKVISAEDFEIPPEDLDQPTGE